MDILEVGSDFSGVGAFNQAMMRLNNPFKEVFACDMDKYSRNTFILNYGEPEYFPKNVYEREIPKKPLDIYMTSPPCQSFSIAGKRKGENSANGVLFYNSHEFIKKNNPRYFIFENVKGLLSDDSGKTFQRWIDFLGGKTVNGNPVIFPHENALPYHLYYQVLNAKDYGVPQNRERIFIIGIRDDSDNNFSFPKPFHLEKRLKDVLDEIVDEKYFLSDLMLEKITFNGKKDGIVADINKGGERGAVYSETSKIMSCLSATDYKQPKQVIVKYDYPKVKLQLESKYEQSGRIYDEFGISPTITTMGGGNTEPKVCIQKNKENIFNGFKIRKLTPRECFRLMDFPDSFVFNVSDSQAYKQAGNSIVVNVLYEILKKLKL